VEIIQRLLMVAPAVQVFLLLSQVRQLVELAVAVAVALALVVQQPLVAVLGQISLVVRELLEQLTLAVAVVELVIVAKEVVTAVLVLLLFATH
jgi:hypothetical protein